MSVMVQQLKIVFWPSNSLNWLSVFFSNKLYIVECAVGL